MTGEAVGMESWPMGKTKREIKFPTAFPFKQSIFSIKQTLWTCTISSVHQQMPSSCGSSGMF